MKTGHTSILSKHLAALSFDKLGADTIQQAKYLFLDFLGLACKGREVVSTRQVRAFVKKAGGSAPCAVVGASFKTLPQK